MKRQIKSLKLRMEMGLFIALILVTIMVLAVLPFLSSALGAMNVSEALIVLGQNNYVAYANPVGDLIVTGDIDLTGDLNATGDINGATGRTATVIVATSTSSALSQAQADYLGDGTADDVQIQAAIDEVDALGGGTVLIMEGDYDITATLSITSSRTDLLGVGLATRLLLAASVDSNLISVTGSTEKVRIANMTIVGNKANNASGSAIYINNPGIDTFHTLEYLYINEFAESGVYIADGREVHAYNVTVNSPDDHGYYLAGSDHKFTMVVSSDADKNGFRITASNSHFTDAKAWDSGNDTSAHYAGFWVGPSTGDVIFTACEAQNNYQHGWFTEQATATRITLNGCIAEHNGRAGVGGKQYGARIFNGVDWNIIGGQFFDDDVSPTQESGISFAGGAANNTVMGVHVSGNTGSQIEPGTGNMIRNNTGYTTENWINSTGTGGEQTIAHGLATTPTVVNLWDIEDGALPYQSSAADATNIYITAVNNQDWGTEVLIR